MSALTAVGGLIIAAVFGCLFAITVVADGWTSALLIWAVAFVLAGTVHLGAYLLAKGGRGGALRARREVETPNARSYSP